MKTTIYTYKAGGVQQLLDPELFEHLPDTMRQKWEFEHGEVTVEAEVLAGREVAQAGLQLQGFVPDSGAIMALKGRAYIEELVTDWNVKGDDGKTLPVERASIDKLPSVVVKGFYLSVTAGLEMSKEEEAALKKAAKSAGKTSKRSTRSTSTPAD